MSIQDEIERTKSQIANKRVEIDRLRKHGEALALKSLGLEIGDRIIVDSGGRRGEFEAEVRGVRGWDYRDPKPEAVKIRRDGTASWVSAGWISKWRRK